MEIAEGGGVAHTEKITLRSIAGERYDRIVGYKLGPIPGLVLAGEFGNHDEGECSFEAERDRRRQLQEPPS